MKGNQKQAVKRGIPVSSPYRPSPPITGAAGDQGERTNQGEHMLRTRRTRYLLLAAALSLVAATPVMAEQPNEPRLVPFRATYSGTYQAQVVPPHVIITDTGGRGQATHLGSFELTNRILVDLVRGPVEGCPVPGSTEVFTATLTAANGDAIVLEGTGHGCQTSPTTISVVDTVEVTGGTGRFEGATGSITVRSAVNQAAGSVVVEFVGVISRPGSGS